MPRPGQKKERADARRNHDRLIEAAAAAFAAKGVDASLEDIARRAGVGIGTLYRHFPTREHLVEIVYRREVAALCEAAKELAQRHPPDVALAEWMQRSVGYLAAKRGMASSLRILLDQDSTLFAETSDMVRAALQQLIDAAVAAGTIRGDIDISDIFQILSGIYAAPETADWQQRSHRLIALLMDGLRWGAKPLAHPGSR